MKNKIVMHFSSLFYFLKLYENGKKGERKRHSGIESIDSCTLARYANMQMCLYEYFQRLDFILNAQQSENENKIEKKRKKRTKRKEMERIQNT